MTEPATTQVPPKPWTLDVLEQLATTQGQLATALHEALASLLEFQQQLDGDGSQAAMHDPEAIMLRTLTPLREASEAVAAGEELARLLRAETIRRSGCIRP
jgi:inosine-uridine nucleoside N-ribohydrolase